MCQKIWKMIESRQSYCKESRLQFFGPPCIIPLRHADRRMTVRPSGETELNSLKSRTVMLVPLMFLSVVTRFFSRSRRKAVWSRSQICHQNSHIAKNSRWRPSYFEIIFKPLNDDKSANIEQIRTKFDTETGNQVSKVALPSKFR